MNLQIQGLHVIYFFDWFVYLIWFMILFLFDLYLIGLYFILFVLFIYLFTYFNSCVDIIATRCSDGS